MMGKCCDELMLLVRDGCLQVTRKCRKCNKVITQRKRRPLAVHDRECLWPPRANVKCSDHPLVPELQTIAIISRDDPTEWNDPVNRAAHAMVKYLDSQGVDRTVLHKALTIGYDCANDRKYEP